MRRNRRLFFDGIGNNGARVRKSCGALKVAPAVVDGAGRFVDLVRIEFVILFYIGKVLDEIDDGVVLLQEREIFGGEVGPSAWRWDFEGGRWEMQSDEKFVE